MVKLFVGNLADGIDSSRLRNLFLQYVQVQECDVLKNFAFVHVVTDEDAELVINKLDKYNLDGREIHIERSTSRLRKEPGMGDKCYTCGATDHKTPNCPQEMTRRKKRVGEGEVEVETKKPLLATPLIQNPWQQSKVGGGSEADPELPCPTNPELRTLYDQYLDARTRYFFYRERLSKELAMQPAGAVIQPSAGSAHVTRFDMTRGSPQVQVAPLAQVSAPAQYQPAPVAYAAPVSYQTPYQPAASQITYAQPSYVTPASAAGVPGQTVVVASSQPAAPYNSAPRQVSYTVQQPAQVAVHNGTPQPAAPYVSGNATYRPMYATAVHYSTVPSAQR